MKKNSIYSMSPKLRMVHMCLCDILVGFAELLVNQFMPMIMFWVEAMIVVSKVNGVLQWHWAFVPLPICIYIGLCIILSMTKKYIYEHF